jgi:penicillin-binding protein 1C
MWNVSGVTGAAPAWRDIMNKLSEGEMQITETKENQEEKVFLTNNSNTKTSLVKIISPANHTIIAVDPDIPQANQLVYFESTKPDKNTNWVLNNKIIGEVKGIQYWTPKSGKYKLSIRDKENKILDQIEFEVR